MLMNFLLTLNQPKTNFSNSNLKGVSINCSDDRCLNRVVFIECSRRWYFLKMSFCLLLQIPKIQHHCYGLFPFFLKVMLEINAVINVFNANNIFAPKSSKQVFISSVFQKKYKNSILIFLILFLGFLYVFY